MADKHVTATREQQRRRGSFPLLVLLLLTALIGCGSEKPNPPVGKLTHLWVIGSTNVAQDPGAHLDVTDRLLTGLSAMGNTKVAYIGPGGERSRADFNAYTGDKISLSTVLHFDHPSNCMYSSYQVIRAGQSIQQAELYTLTTEGEPGETDLDCASRHAKLVYADFVAHGL